MTSVDGFVEYSFIQPVLVVRKGFLLGHTVRFLTGMRDLN